MAKRKFEQVFEDLQAITDELESGDLPLEDAIAKYEKGVKALKECYIILNAAEKKIEKLVADLDGTIKTETFATGNGDI